MIMKDHKYSMPKKGKTFNELFKYSLFANFIILKIKYNQIYNLSDLVEWGNSLLKQLQQY